MSKTVGNFIINLLLELLGQMSRMYLSLVADCTFFAFSMYAFFMSALDALDATPNIS